MEQQEGDTWTMPPFWEAEHRDRRRLRRSYSLLLTSTSLLALFLVIALVFALIVVPTLRSFASNILRPRTVKNSWDSLNLVLVLFAIVCGFLSRNNAAETLTPRSRYHNHRTFSNPSTPPHWYQCNYSQTPRRSFNRLRSFNSYPDLRQHIAADERFRFHDDTHLLRHPRPEAEEEEEKEMVIEKVAAAPPQSPPDAVRRNVKRAYRAETIEKREENDLDLKNSPPPRSPPSPPPPATRRIGVRPNVKRAYQAETIEKHETNDLDAKISPPPPSPPPPATRTNGVRRNVKAERNDSVVKSSPPPPPPAEEGKTMQGKKKRGIATKEFLTSLRGTKKKQRQRSVENFVSILNSEPLFPQPPPAPPPPKVFQNLFSLKKGKHKNRHFVSVATKTNISDKREHSSSYRLEDKVMMAGNESPLIPIPPPPPPPPFKLPAWKFRVQGDFVRVDSIGSSRSGSPDLDEVSVESVDTPTRSTHDETSQCNSPFAKDGEYSARVSAPSLFCPSPDVDTKADNFIESFRAGLRMAKMNSMKERQGIGRSNLGPSPNHEWN
ncbi:verprolin protein [Spatholobus suberectus]|nr:verprolin protein [Spatholobus suberectus]